MPYLSQPSLYRILDANLDRAREGLRVIEEWCRFELRHPELTGLCKELRQKLATWHTPEMRAARDTQQDPGTGLTHLQEQRREGIGQVLLANLCRVQEALRVVEEYGKLYSSELGTDAKTMRYQVYILETKLFAYNRQQLLQSSLYLITTPVPELLFVVESALKGGVRLVQYRDKDADDLTRLKNARQLKELCQRYDALFILNDRVDMVLAVDGDGVHLGQQDLPVEVARNILGSHRIIGCSTTNPEEMERAIAMGADYIGVGPVFATPTKAGKVPTGFQYIRYAREHSTLPWFAIGGIDTNNVGEVLDHGAQRVAVVRAIMQADQPTLITQSFIRQLHR